MAINYKTLDGLRRGRSEHENHLVDCLVAGRVSRREFMRHGSVLGLSLPYLASVATAIGLETRPRAAHAAAAGGTVRIAQIVPAAAIDPVKIADGGGITVLSQVAETLVLSGANLTAEPVLAESWSPNKDGTVWTFKLRQGVKFHDGSPMTADDVVYTYKLQANPKSGSNALSALGGVLTPSGVKKVDDFTVEFHLEAPNGNFPYLTSSDNYNMIILPKGYDPGKWQGSFIGTGPFKMKSYTPKQGASFVRNEDYWGTKAKPAGTEFTFYDTPTPSVLALTSGTIDVLGQFSVNSGQQLLNGGFNVIKLKSSAHRELSMRCDQAPFTDPRVRQAVALTLDRPAIIQALFKGFADLGNDSPFAPVFPSTNTSIPQRKKDLAKAKSLLAAAGHGSGFKTQLIGNDMLEIPQYAQIVAEAAKTIGVNINVKIESSSVYYGKATFGNSDWLDATMSMVDYGHRSVPNVFLTAPLQTINAKKGTGSWNAAHFSNAQYDKLSNQYIATVDLTTQRKIAGQIETLLLEQTPIIFGYFYNYLTATAKNVTGAYPTAIGHIFLWNAAKS